MQDIVLKTIDGTQNTYQNVDKIAIPTPDGNTAIFTEGQAVSKTVEPNFAGGIDMTVPISDGELVTKLTVKKPEALISDNIVKDVEIAGIVGTGSAGGGSSATPDWLQNDPAQQDYIKNRPGGYIADYEPITLEFDGNEDGKTVIILYENTDSSGDHVIQKAIKVSDLFFTKEQLVGATVSFKQGTETGNVTISENDIYDDGFSISCEFFGSIGVDRYPITEDITLTKGTYFIKFTENNEDTYVTNLTTVEQKQVPVKISEAFISIPEASSDTYGGIKAEYTGDSFYSIAAKIKNDGQLYVPNTNRLPASSSSQSGMFLRVNSAGDPEWQSVPNANGGAF